jgi:thiamine pyrophosphate-dependent acetolactate synthase large subunit-like protein
VKLTGAQIIAKALKVNGVGYVAGIPGERGGALVQSLLATGTEIPFIQVMQGHNAVHLADGYFRACGRPMAVLLPVPLGISKALEAAAVALADSSAMLLISGGNGTQDDGYRPATRTFREHRRVTSVDQLAQTLRHAFNSLCGAGVGPVSLDIPVAVQNALAESSPAPATLRASREGLRPVSTSDMETNATVMVGARAVQAMARNMFPFDRVMSLWSANEPVLGWAVPAAIGAKLAVPARQVVCVVGAGDFLQSMQELAVCMMHSIPVVFLVFSDNSQAPSNDEQIPLDRYRSGAFSLPDGKPYSPDFSGIARLLGLDAWRVEHASQLVPAFTKALNSNGPSLVEVVCETGSPSL